MTRNYFVTIYRKDNTAVTELFYTLRDANARALSIVDSPARGWDIVKYGRANALTLDIFGSFYSFGH